MKNATDRGRRGIVFLPVVALLAVLMLLAATTALLSQVELYASRNYELQETTRLLMRAVRLYAIEILHQDKFGLDGVPYNYEVLVGDGGPDTDFYPCDIATNALLYDDENFDSLHEEWVGCGQIEGPEWRVFTAVDTGDGWELNWLDASVALAGQNMLGGRLRGQFWLHFWPFDGMGLDVNATGNIQGAGDTHAQGQGLTAFEAYLAQAIDEVPGVGTFEAEQAARSLVQGRYGVDIRPGASGTNDSDLWPTLLLDINADGYLETSATDEPTEFNPEWIESGMDDWAFGPMDLRAVLAGSMWRVHRSSRITNILQAAGVAPQFYSYFHPRGASTILAGRSIRGGASVFSNTNPTGAPGAAYPFLNYDGAPLVSPSTGQPLWLQRQFQGAIDLTGTNTQKAQASKDLRDFLLDLGPVVLDASGNPLAAADIEPIIHQVALNLIDMVDTDSYVTVDTDTYSGTDYELSGVEPTPYVAEVEAAVNTSQEPFMPDPTTGSLSAAESRATQKVGIVAESIYNDANSSGGWDVGEEIWLDTKANGKYQPGEPQVYDGGDGWDTGPGTTGLLLHVDNNPPTGWGKYIKLVNPWNVDLPLADYRLVVPGTSGLREWYLDVDVDAVTVTWRSRPLSNENRIEVYWDDEGKGSWQTREPSGTEGLVIDFAGTDKYVPARGHFLIVDDVAAFTKPPDNPAFRLARVPPECWMATPYINHIHEAGGGNVGEGGVPDDEFENTGLPTLIELRTQVDAQMYADVPGNSALVMRFEVQENPGEDDDDNFAGANWSTQIADPRPCWWRGAAMTDAWAMDTGNVGPRTLPVWYEDNTADSTRGAGWFNGNWRGSGQVGSGDNWNLSATVDDEIYAGDDNLLHSFPPVGPVTVDMEMYSGAVGQEVSVMNLGALPSPGYIGFCHAGMEWCTLSLTRLPPGDHGDFGEAELVYLRNFTDYLTGPTSPFEDGLDNDGDGVTDASDTGAQALDRGGPEWRVRGKVNVNFLPDLSGEEGGAHKLKAIFSYPVLDHVWSVSPDARAADLVSAIHNEGDSWTAPFSSVDDFFERNPELFQVDFDGDGYPDDGAHPNSFRREALARFMYNLVTVRSNVWGVFAAIRVGVDADGDGLEDDEVADQRFYTIVIDRTHDPIQVILTAEEPKPFWLAD